MFFLTRLPCQANIGNKGIVSKAALKNKNCVHIRQKNKIKSKITTLKQTQMHPICLIVVAKTEV